MPVNFGFTAPTGAPALIFQFDITTRFILIQNNNDTNILCVGFTQASTTITDAMFVRPLETYPIPLDTSKGDIWVLGNITTIAGVLVRG